MSLEGRECKRFEEGEERVEETLSVDGFTCTIHGIATICMDRPTRSAPRILQGFCKECPFLRQPNLPPHLIHLKSPISLTYSHLAFTPRPDSPVIP